MILFIVGVVIVAAFLVALFTLSVKMVGWVWTLGTLLVCAVVLSGVFILSVGAVQMGWASE